MAMGLCGGAKGTVIMADGNKGDDQIYMVILGLLCGITVIGLMGPIGMLVASATILIGALAGVGSRRRCCNRACRRRARYGDGRPGGLAARTDARHG